MRKRGLFALMLMFVGVVAAIIFPIWGVIVESKIGRAGHVWPMALLFYATGAVLVFGGALLGWEGKPLAATAAVWILVLIIWDFHVDNDYNAHRCVDTATGQFVKAADWYLDSNAVCYPDPRYRQTLSN